MGDCVCIYVHEMGDDDFRGEGKILRQGVNNTTGRSEEKEMGRGRVRNVIV